MDYLSLLMKLQLVIGGAYLIFGVFAPAKNGDQLFIYKLLPLFTGILMLSVYYLT